MSTVERPRPWFLQQSSKRERCAQARTVGLAKEKNGRASRLLQPQARQGLEGRRSRCRWVSAVEPRQWSGSGTPESASKMASLPFFVSFYTALRQGSGTELQVKSMALHVKQKKNGKMFFIATNSKTYKSAAKTPTQRLLSTINYSLSIIHYPHIAQS